MNAMSKFSSSLAKHGKYGRRPNVVIPEQTASAYIAISLLQLDVLMAIECMYDSHLCTAITGNRVVPQATVRSRNGLLGMAAMSSYYSSKGNETQHWGNHGAGHDSIRIEETERQLGM